MFIAYAILAVLASVMLVFSAYGKITRQQRLADQMATLKVPSNLVPVLGILLIAGAAGLLIGLWWAPLGIAAAVGLTLYFIGAVGAHGRVGDYKGAAPAAVILIVSVVLIVLRSATV